MAGDPGRGEGGAAAAAPAWHADGDIKGCGVEGMTAGATVQPFQGTFADDGAASAKGDAASAAILNRVAPMQDDTAADGCAAAARGLLNTWVLWPGRCPHPCRDLGGRDYEEPFQLLRR